VLVLAVPLKFKRAPGVVVLNHTDCVNTCGPVKFDDVEIYVLVPLNEYAVPDKGPATEVDVPLSVPLSEALAELSGTVDPLA
jgi:hypothetical protein